jgi:hypothetical protein
VKIAAATLVALMLGGCAVDYDEHVRRKTMNCD